MLATKKPYKLGEWIASGVMIGSFIGLLFSKLALGMILGFFVGVMMDTEKRKSMAKPTEKSSNDPSDSLG